MTELEPKTCTVCGQRLGVLNTDLISGRMCGGCANGTSPAARAMRDAQKAREAAAFERKVAAERAEFYRAAPSLQAVLRRSYAHLAWRLAVGAAACVASAELGFRLLDQGRLRFTTGIFGILFLGVLLFMAKHPVDAARGRKAATPAGVAYVAGVAVAGALILRAQAAALVTTADKYVYDHAPLTFSTKEWWMLRAAGFGAAVVVGLLTALLFERGNRVEIAREYANARG